MLDIDISTNLDAIDDFLDDFTLNIFIGSARRAIDRTVVSARADATKHIRKTVNIKAKDLKNKIKIGKAKGGINSLQGFVDFDGAPIPLLEFVTGSNDVPNNKGVPIKKRKVLKIKILKGKSRKLRGAFIAKVHSKQVFRRGRSGGFYKQSAPSIAEWMSRNNLRDPVLKRAQDTFNRTFKHEYQFRMSKAKAKINSASLKIPT